MNNYTVDGRYIIDSKGGYTDVNRWHPMPVPDGIDASEPDITFGGGRPGFPSHWAARPPLPPVPVVKTQEQINHEAFMEWCSRTGLYSPAPTWLAACAYARGGKA